MKIKVDKTEDGWTVSAKYNERNYVKHYSKNPNVEPHALGESHVIAKFKKYLEEVAGVND